MKNDKTADVAEQMAILGAEARVKRFVLHGFTEEIAIRRNVAGIGLLHYYFGVGLAECSGVAIAAGMR